MYKSTRKQCSYDHRLKELVRSTGNLDVALQRGVPRSTARGWLTKNMSDVITVDTLDMSLVELQREVVALRRRNARLIAFLHLISTVMKVTHFTLSQIWFPQEVQKLRVLQAMTEGKPTVFVNGELVKGVRNLNLTSIANATFTEFLTGNSAIYRFDSADPTKFYTGYVLP